MSIGWQLFRFVCLLQMMAATYFSFASLINFLNGRGFSNLLETIAFVLIAAFATFALNLLNTNYPDKPIAGKQKSVFNWLFLLNFLLLAFLFAHFFSSYRFLNMFKNLTGRSAFSLSFRFWLPTILFMAMIVFQFMLLYGLYILRRLIYINFFTQQQFEFEGREKN